MLKQVQHDDGGGVRMLNHVQHGARRECTHTPRPLHNTEYHKREDKPASATFKLQDTDLDDLAHSMLNSACAMALPAISFFTGRSTASHAKAGVAVCHLHVQ